MMEMDQNKNEERKDPARDPFSQLMFGSRGQTGARKVNEGAGFGKLENINLDELMENIDTLVLSVRELTPLFGKIGPALKQIFIKK